MDTLQAILLGIVQGITEFLPVSSSGHLQIAKELLGVELEENLTFDVALHAATVLSTIVVLWSEVWRLLKGLFSRRFNAEQAYVLKLVLSMIPIGVIGFLFKDRINAMLDAEADEITGAARYERKEGRKAYRAGVCRKITDREIDAAALAVYTGTSGMGFEEVEPLWPKLNPDAKEQYRLLARLAIMAARTEALA